MWKLIGAIVESLPVVLRKLPGRSTDTFANQGVQRGTLRFRCTASELGSRSSEPLNSFRIIHVARSPDKRTLRLGFVCTTGYFEFDLLCAFRSFSRHASIVTSAGLEGKGRTPTQRWSPPTCLVG
jgi:hypothetical protein